MTFPPWKLEVSGWMANHQYGSLEFTRIDHPRQLVIKLVHDFQSFVPQTLQSRWSSSYAWVPPLIGCVYVIKLNLRKSYKIDRRSFPSLAASKKTTSSNKSVNNHTLFVVRKISLIKISQWQMWIQGRCQYFKTNYNLSKRELEKKKVSRTLIPIDGI